MKRNTVWLALWDAQHMPREAISEMRRLSAKAAGSQIQPAEVGGSKVSVVEPISPSECSARFWRLGTFAIGLTQPVVSTTFFCLRFSSTYGRNHVPLAAGRSAPYPNLHRLSTVLVRDAIQQTPSTEAQWCETGRRYSPTGPLRLQDVRGLARYSFLAYLDSPWSLDSFFRPVVPTSPPDYSAPSPIDHFSNHMSAYLYLVHATYRLALQQPSRQSLRSWLPAAMSASLGVRSRITHP